MERDEEEQKEAEREMERGGTKVKGREGQGGRDKEGE